MLRAPNLPSPSKVWVSSLKLPLLSCLTFSCFRALKPSPVSLVRRLSTKTLLKPFSTSHRSPYFCRSLSMASSPSSRAMFSAGSNGGEGKREILVQHLLVRENDLNLLTELQQRIVGGEDLSDLALEYSICPSKENGGMLGWVRRGQLVPEFEEAAFNAALNKVVRCKTKFGWHLLEVLSESYREESVLEDIEPVDLHSKMQDQNFIEEAQLIDVREPEEV